MIKELGNLENSAFSRGQGLLSDFRDENDTTVRINSKHSNPTINSPANILHFFYQQVERHANKVALVQEGREVTYRELDQQSDTLAFMLDQKLNLNREDKIAVYLPRCPDEVIAILAILKLGCVYVPINTNDPDSRIQFILNDTAAKAVLSNQLEVGNIDTELEKFTIQDVLSNPLQSYPRYDSESDATAYIMYTSGSTGNPKGVMIPHQAIIRLAESPDYIDVDSNDRIAQIVNPAFDPAIFETWVGLLNGMTLTYPNARQLENILGNNNFQEFMATMISLFS